MTIARTTFTAALMLASLTALAGTDKPAGPLQLVNINLQPARVSPNPQGALLLAEATGCYIEFVGRGQQPGQYQFRVAPTQKVSAFDACLESLRRQPGVTGVAVSK